MIKQITVFAFPAILFLFAALSSCNKATKPKVSEKENQLYDEYIEQSKAFLSAESYDSALLYTDSALVVANNLNDNQKSANALRLKGVAWRNNGDYEVAKAAFFKAHSICEQSRETKTQAVVELSLSTYYLRIADNDSSIYYAELALQHYEKINDSAGIARALNTLGSTLQQIGRRDEALTYYFRAQDIYGLLGDKQRQTYVLNNIGIIYKFFEEYDQALELFEKCKTVSENAGNQYMTIVSSMNIAGIYYFTDQTEKAEKAYQEILETHKEYLNVNTRAAIYISLGAIYAELDKPEVSYDYVTKALEIARKSKNLRSETQAYYKLAHYYLDKGNLSKAEQYFKKTIKGAKKTSDLQHLSYGYKHLSAIQEKRGNYKSALANFKLSKEINDSIINEKKLEIIYNLETKYEKKKDEAEILRLSNENAQQQIANSELKMQLGTVFGVVILLGGILFYIRLKNRKNKIIAEQRIRQLEEEQKLLAAQSVIVGQENERKRIAQELHDGIGVLLSTASIHFSNVEESSTDEKTAELLNKANKLLKQAGGEVRKISHDMMPGVLSKFGLQEALEDIFENVEDAGSISVDCRVDLADEKLNENTEIILYRIVQEILNNSLKHAHANHISFSMEKEDNTIVIHYKDDGDGFAQSEMQSTKSLGLSGIKSRIDFLNGQMKLTSSPGNGVAYEIRIPLA
jgi:signal transduction histidine kinase/Flp pilus assembly protein TadD